MNDLKASIEKYLETIYQDYVAHTTRCKCDADYAERTNAHFKKTMSVEYGRKYARIVTDGSVHSFVVLEDESKFKVGDILKAAGWKTPVKNAARGNLFTGYTTSWTGANYLLLHHKKSVI